MIPYGRQDINETDIASVLEALTSDFLTQGPKVPKFEAKLAKITQAKHAVAANSATSALHVACLALGLGEGDALWTSPISFVASSNCALYCGADVDFVDIDPVTYNMSVDALEAKLMAAELGGKLPKIVVPVHLCGQSADMKGIKALSDKYGFKIIEDASHAVGAHYRDAPVGSCKYSDIAIFSFHPVKIVTTAEGGVAITQNSEIAQKMRLLISHGVTRDPQIMRGTPHGGWYYEQVDLGFNYRMTELQAALGVTQLDRLSDFVSRRTEIAKRYDDVLANLPLQTPQQSPECDSSWHLYVIRLKGFDDKKAEIFSRLREAGVGVNLHYMPIYKQPYYSDLGFDYNYLPEAEAYYREAISIPVFTGLSEADQDYVVKALEGCLL